MGFSPRSLLFMLSMTKKIAGKSPRDISTKAIAVANRQNVNQCRMPRNRPESLIAQVGRGFAGRRVIARMIPDRMANPQTRKLRRKPRAELLMPKAVHPADFTESTMAP